MKTLILQLVIIFCASTLFAQWVPVNNGLDDHPPTTLMPLGEDMVLGTYGGGIYKTTNNGDSWENYNGNLGNLNVNDIRGAGSYTSLFVATEGGPFYTDDMVDYLDCTSTGLTNTDISFFWILDNELGGDFMASANGGGIFLSDEYTGPWTAASNILGADLTVSDIGGYSEDEQEYMVLSTNEGTFWAVNGATEWTAMNNGLTGEALKVNRIAGLGFMILIATDDGLYYNYEIADEWLQLIPNEKLNTVLVVMSPMLPTGFGCFAFGENSFYSEDLFTWSPIIMDGVIGEVTAAHTNSTHIFVGVTTSGKDDKLSGGMFRASLDQLVVGVKEPSGDKNTGLLGQNYPNPFSGLTTISYRLNKTDYVSIAVYDICGKKVHSLVNQKQATGDYQLGFDARNFSEGIYYYTLEIGTTYTETKKMVIKR